MSVFLEVYTLSFYISFLAIIVMITLKSSEIRSGKKFWITKILDKMNNFFTTLAINIKIIISYINKKSAIALIQWIAYHILLWVRETYVWIHKKAHAHPPSKKVIDMVRGRVEIRKNAGASFFLKSISSSDEEM